MDPKRLKIFGLILLLLEVISIIPLLMIAHYNHSSADDFYYGIKTAHVWSDTGSILGIIQAAFVNVKETYLNWQGSFSGIFSMTLQPSIFGENFYPVGTYIILATYLLGFMLLGKTLFTRFLGNSKKNCFLICFTLFVFSIQLAPFPRQSYYWFNGSVYYTFFHGIALILFALVLRIQGAEKKTKRVLLMVFSILLAFIVGGSNYVAALQSALLLFFFSIYLIASKKRNAVAVSVVSIALILSLGISILAPGNAIRQSMIPDHPSMLKAILVSFFWTGVYIGKWSTLYLIGVFLVLTPLIVDSVRLSDLSFGKPWLVTILTILIISSSFAPPHYGLGELPERVLNILFYLFILLFSLNVFYYAGWFVKQQIPILSIEFLQWMSRKRIHYPMFFFIAGSICLLVAFVQEPDIAGKEAMQSLISGDAVQYDSEANARLNLYLDANIRDVVVKEYSVKPSLLYNDDIGTDANDWQNESVAKFYGKDRVVKIARN